MSQVNVRNEGPWQWLVDGWHGLRDKAANALTHFKHDEQVPEEAHKWGLVATDLTDDGDEFHLEMELAGLTKDDIQVDLNERMLTVSGSRQSSNERRSGQHIITERAFGRFQRSLQLPGDVDKQKTTASYRDGVLKITLPKSQPETKRTITVSKG